MIALLEQNLVPWLAQVLILAAAGSLLPVLFRVQHPRTHLVWCHFLLAACLVFPLLEPRRLLTMPLAPRALIWILMAGFLGRLGWLLAGVWRVRRYRIGATPLYPVPDSVQAASALTSADAVVCVSPDTPGPVMLGSLCPVVLLPESFLGLNEEAQCGIACHEFLHVRRNDWLVTMAEEICGALFWFNPGIWWLLSQARLAREQVVDAETVRLTDASDSYVNALLAIARARPTLDLAPSPLFLRRRHLAQRMQLLLKEVEMSRLRLSASYGSMAAILLVAGWFAAASFPLAGSPAPERAHISASARAPVFAPSAEPMAPRPLELAQRQVLRAPRPQLPSAQPRVDPEAPVPADPHEPVTGGVRIAATPADRAAALGLIERAMQNSDMHIAGTPPFLLDISFTAAGNVQYTGAGQISETWLSGQAWRWTAHLGAYSQVQTGTGGMTVAENPGAIPLRLHMVRNAVFWPVRRIGLAGLRTADAQVNGLRVTCTLQSGIMDNRANLSFRLWEETEYCMDPATGVLQVYSEAPGSYAVYGYSRNLDFHGRRVPDHVTIFLAGSEAVNADINITDAAGVSLTSLAPSQQALGKGPAVRAAMPERFRLDQPGSAGSAEIKPVIVLAEINPDGSVLESELVSAADASLGQPALDAVKSTHFPPTGLQRQVYINVRFAPPSQN